jgi:hypothetical protein
VSVCVCVCARATICVYCSCNPLKFDFFFACAYVLSLMTYAVCCDVLFCSIAEEGCSPKMSFLVFLFYFLGVWTSIF